MPLYIAIPVCIIITCAGAWAIKQLLVSGGLVRSQEARDFWEPKTAGINIAR